MAKETPQERYHRVRAEADLRNQLMKEFNKTRDPIHLYTYNEIVKIRKWVVFFGVLAILSLIGAIIVWLGTGV